MLFDTVGVMLAQPLDLTDAPLASLRLFAHSVKFSPLLGRQNLVDLMAEAQGGQIIITHNSGVLHGQFFSFLLIEARGFDQFPLGRFVAVNLFHVFAHDFLVRCLDGPQLLLLFLAEIERFEMRWNTGTGIVRLVLTAIHHALRMGSNRHESEGNGASCQKAESRGREFGESNHVDSLKMNWIGLI